MKNKGKMLNTSNILVAQEPRALVISDQSSKQNHEGESVEEEESVGLDSKYDELNIVEEIDNLNNKILAYMARKFKNLIFPKSRLFKAKKYFNNYNI